MLRHTLATVWDRILAYIIDIVILTFLAFSILSSLGENAFIIVSLCLWLYFPVLEYILNGQTLGKMALRIKVVPIHGFHLDLYQILMRWVFMPLEIGATAGGLASIIIGLSEKRQRIGDILANTIVIKKNKDHSLELSELKKLQNSVHEVTYPQVTKYNDAQVLVMKEVLHRYEQNPDMEESQTLLKSLLSKIKKDLDIHDSNETRGTAFIHTLIRDYVVLTR